MHSVLHKTTIIKPTDRSPSTTETPRPDKSDFATRVAQAELGPAYARPELDGWCDRSPAEIALLRAVNWSRA